MTTLALCDHSVRSARRTHEASLLTVVTASWASSHKIRYRRALLGALRFLAFLLSEHPVRFLLLRQEEPCHGTADEYDQQVRRQRVEPYVKRRREAQGRRRGQPPVAESPLDHPVRPPDYAHKPSHEDGPPVEPPDVQGQEHGRQRLQDPHPAGQLQGDGVIRCGEGPDESPYKHYRRADP